MVILKEVSKEEAKAFFLKEDLSFNENSSCLCAKDGDEVLGYCLFDIDAEKMTIRAIQPQNDIMLCDGILRSSLHIAASRNLKNANFIDNAPEKIFKLLDFLIGENELNINKLFESKCCCKKD